jgi:hypothetical protein
VAPGNQTIDFENYDAKYDSNQTFNSQDKDAMTNRAINIERTHKIKDS